jgi:hypothetical protein
MASPGIRLAILEAGTDIFLLPIDAPHFELRLP